MRLVHWESQDRPDPQEFLETLADLEKVERRDPQDPPVLRADQVCLDRLVCLAFLVREVYLASLACLD